MFNLIKLTGWMILFSLMVGCGEDPCLDCIADPCIEGVCECEMKGWSYLDIAVRCLSCAPTTTGTAVIEVDGAKVAEITFTGKNSFTKSLNRIPTTGTVPYRVTVKQGSFEEAGNLAMIQCEATVLSVAIP